MSALQKRLQVSFPPFAPPPGKVEVRLEEGYQPQPLDVISKKDREHIPHVGNRRFRISVEMRVERYVAAKTRIDKSYIIHEIIEAVHGSGGRFIRQQTSSRRQQQQNDNGEGGNGNNEGTTVNYIYFAMGRKQIKDKVSHAMRLAVARRDSNTILSRRNSWPEVIEEVRRGTSNNMQPGLQQMQEWSQNVGGQSGSGEISTSISESDQDDTMIKERPMVGRMEYHHDMGGNNDNDENRKGYSNNKMQRRRGEARERRQSWPAPHGIKKENHSAFAGRGGHWQVDDFFDPSDDDDDSLSSSQEWDQSKRQGKTSEELDACASSTAGGSSLNDFRALTGPKQEIAEKMLLDFHPCDNNNNDNDDDSSWDEPVSFHKRNTYI